MLSRSGDGARDLSPKTLVLYRQLLTTLCKWLEDPELSEVKAENLAAFMRYLDGEYLQGSGAVLSTSARDNFWKATRSFFRWAEEELGITRPDNDLKRPKAVWGEIQPYSREEIVKILDYCDFTAPSRGKFEPYRMRRPTALRDRAIVLVLLETGIRIGELCRLEMRDVNIDAGEIHVRPYHSGVKSKARTIPIEKGVQKALWKFRVKEREYAERDDLFFDTNIHSLESIFRRMEERTQIPDVHAHRFRHTFAIEYLRNGGDVFTLQRLLGHSSLEMVKRYLAIAQADLKAAHKRASPVEKWKL